MNYYNYFIDNFWFLFIKRLIRFKIILQILTINTIQKLLLGMVFEIIVKSCRIVNLLRR